MMTQYEEQLIRQVIAGNLSKVDVLKQMVASGTIKTIEEYDNMAQHIDDRVMKAQKNN